MPDIVPVEIIENKILVIRGHKVMIDRDLAELYGVKTMVLNQAVKRNAKRFPEEFMFQLTNEEKTEVITNCDRLKEIKFSPHNPYVFTEYGVAMLSGVLNSEQAIFANIQIIKAFVKLREMALANKDLNKRVDDLERMLISYARENNANIEEIFKQLAYLTDITKPAQIGFKTEQ
jgi:hypothetical protein